MVSPRGWSDPPKESGGIAILREGEAAEFLRRRIERPSRIGFYGLLFFGVLTAFFGLLTAGIGGSLGSIGRSPLSTGIIVLGGVLILLGWGQHLLYRRDLAHWPDQAILWDQGIELVLHNGEVRGVSWTDPDLAINLVARRAPPPARREFLLVWMTEGRIPSAELSEAGFDEVQRAAVAHGVTVIQNRRGRRPDATQTVEIRQSPARRLAGTSDRPRSERKKKSTPTGQS